MFSSSGKGKLNGNVSPLLPMIFSEVSSSVDVFGGSIGSGSGVVSPPGFIEEFFLDFDFESLKPILKRLVGVMAAKAAEMKVVAVPSIQTQADPLFRSGFWMMNALPIEGLLQKGFLCEVTELILQLLKIMENIDDGPSSLADQVYGVYFRWAKLNTDEILKVVVGIGWKWDSCTTRRLICLCMFIGYACNYFGDRSCDAKNQKIIQPIDAISIDDIFCKDIDKWTGKVDLSGSSSIGDDYKAALQGEVMGKWELVMDDDEMGSKSSYRV
ncbi:hypothetical protein GIB67_018804 [Kingdonia uniflora]|uniref:Uncharacterized protein n=1 Tax=Kingdonia uniflora TaxID=39325 RepID=A0A7J7NED5_9MAGN|nr:hypothetical protein GIB67_018804 [Kingdonia uniflora]